MLKPYVGATVHYIPMSDEELKCANCDQPRAAIITRVHNLRDVDLVVFTSSASWPVHVRTAIPYALYTDKTPHWRWMHDAGSQLSEETADGVKRYDTAASAVTWAKDAVQIMSKAPLQDALRALVAGRGDRDRLLLERWALALEGHLVDTSVIFEVDKEGKTHVGVTTEEGIVLEDSA